MIKLGPHICKANTSLLLSFIPSLMFILFIIMLSRCLSQEEWAIVKFEWVLITTFVFPFRCSPLGSLHISGGNVWPPQMSVFKRWAKLSPTLNLLKCMLGSKHFLRLFKVSFFFFLLLFGRGNTPVVLVDAWGQRLVCAKYVLYCLSYILSQHYVLTLWFLLLVWDLRGSLLALLGNHS